MRFAASGQWARCPAHILSRLLGGIDPLRLYSALSVGSSSSSSSSSQAAGTQHRAAQGEAAVSAAVAALREALQALVEGPASGAPRRWYLEVKTLI